MLLSFIAGPTAYFCGKWPHWVSILKDLFTLITTACLLFLVSNKKTLTHIIDLVQALVVHSHIPSSLALARLPLNRPLPSSKNLLFQNEARCTTFLVRISFICMRKKKKMISIRKAEDLPSF